MNNPSSTKLISTYASMKFIQAQIIPGILTLYNDKITFKANGILENYEIKSLFSFEEIQNVKFGLSLTPFRLTIVESDGEPWIFDQVPRKDGKKFAELYKVLTSH
ncbi:hypothetical protein [Staphylococcus nepalensis]|uniref:hypothetical protein n=1 Tax=Staphylococcus nepalensis TaxID=214473 RepID=UPI001F624559|nr:hypothetical protein [Staphylococcus nepalensis]